MTVRRSTEVLSEKARGLDGLWLPAPGADHAFGLLSTEYQLSFRSEFPIVLIESGTHDPQRRVARREEQMANLMRRCDTQNQLQWDDASALCERRFYAVIENATIASARLFVEGYGEPTSEGPPALAVDIGGPEKKVRWLSCASLAGSARKKPPRC
jgi:hypothetical protein